MSTEIAVPDEPEIDSRIEKIVWKGLGRRSARQIAEEAGISPEVVLRVKRQLLDSVDVLTIQEKRQKLLVDLQDMAETAREDYEKATYEFKAGLMNSSIAAIKAVMVELNRADKADNAKIEALNALRVRELVSLMNEVVDAGVREVAEQYDLDEEEVFSIFNGKLAEAASKRDAL